MAFFGWFNRRMNRLSKRAKQRNRFSKRPRKQSDHPNTNLQPIIDNSEPLDNATPLNEQKITNVKSLDVPTTAITVFYLDAEGNSLHDPDILVGKSGDSLNLRLPKFSDYILTDIDNFTSQFSSTNQKITFCYTLRLAAPIKIYSVDLDSSAMLAPIVMVSGKLNQLYDISAPKIAGYKVTNSTGKKYGYFDYQSHDVVFYYRHEQWRTVQPVEYYVKLQAPHIVYEGPNGRPLKTKLRSNLIIKVFLKVITSTDEVWYNIGGSQWINGVQSRQSEAPVGVATKPITRLISQVTELTGYIDFIDHQIVNVYDQPYGKIKNQIISGTTVTISSVMIDDQQIKWYTIGESEVIPARYVIIK